MITPRSQNVIAVLRLLTIPNGRSHHPARPQTRKGLPSALTPVDTRHRFWAKVVTRGAAAAIEPPAIEPRRETPTRVVVCTEQIPQRRRDVFGIRARAGVTSAETRRRSSRPAAHRTPPQSPPRTPARSALLHRFRLRQLQSSWFRRWHVRARNAAFIAHAARASAEQKSVMVHDICQWISSDAASGAAGTSPPGRPARRQCHPRQMQRVVVQVAGGDERRRIPRLRLQSRFVVRPVERPDDIPIDPRRHAASRHMAV